MQEVKKKITRTFTGEVVSNKSDKTIVVRVDRTVMDSKYGKRRRVSKRFQVHDAKNVHCVGDRVTFVECRPLSKHKRWRVVQGR